MKLLPFTSPTEIATAIPMVVAHLQAGGLIAYPTETVYGFGGLVREDAVQALTALKSRDDAKPFLLLIREAADVPGLEWNSAAQKLARTFWPGPLTLALRTRAVFPPRVLSDEGTVAVRATPHEGARAILQALKQPITSTSANVPGNSPAMSGSEAQSVLNELGAPDVWVLDGGELAPSPPSTVVDCAQDRPRVVRRGAITVEALTQIVDVADD